MSLPAGFTPYVTSARRFYFAKERALRAQQLDGLADCFRAKRLAEPGTRLWRRLPGRAHLLAAGVLAVEEVIGAGVAELRLYGLRPSVAEALITQLERIAATMTTFQTGPRIGEIYDQDPVTLVAAAARTTSLTSETYEVGDRGDLRLDVDVSAISGTGASLHVQIETRRDTDDAWVVREAVGPLSAVGIARLVAPGCDRFVRAVCTMAGSSPSVTFSVSGEAV